MTLSGASSGRLGYRALVPAALQPPGERVDGCAMLTMAIEDPPIARRRPFVDGLVRLAAASVLLGSVLSVGYLATVAWVNHSWVSDWTLVLIALLVVGILIGLALGSWFVLRSRHLARGRHNYLRLALLALVPGLLLGLYFSGFVAGGLISTWVRHSPFGNPHGPGVLTVASAPAQASLASLMLEPADIGAGWYPEAKPNPSLMPTTAQETGQGQLVRVKDFINSDHWDGSVWRKDGTTIEVLLHFDSAADANNYPDLWKAEDPGVALSPTVVGQTVVLEGVTPTNWRHAMFTVGDNYFEVQEATVDSLPTSAQFQTVVAAAVAKATASS